jgi:eukaryotic-like serine/threonine-protein kinase
MPLSPGIRLGPYEIQATLGAGGMGEVYKARDTRLDRTVAVKIMPAALAHDPQFRERFDREARAISQLDHPNICTLYDVGDEAGTSYLVMQYLEGETLSDRLARGPIPIAEALSIATQIASALDRAHRAGIVHRDLKPGNVMLTKSGAGSTGSPQAKLLDFGLAKAAGAVSGGPELSRLPTTPAGITAQGTILGTFQYMSPEQIEGEDADTRADIFAFGAVLYEMVTGKKAFEGKSQASLIGAIMQSEPPPISTLQKMAPTAIDHLVRRCLAKDRDARWQSARDLVIELEWIASGGGTAAQAGGAAPRERRSVRMAWGTAAIAGIAFVAAAVPLALSIFRQPDAPPPVRFAIEPPADVGIDANVRPVLSPDGRRLAFAGRKTGGNLTAFVRPLDSLDARPLAATEGMTPVMFWSPDSRYIGFFAGGRLKKIDVTGGPAQLLCDVVPTAGIVGGTWGSGGVIVFAGGDGQHLYRVPEAGGTATVLTTVDKAAQQTAHVTPYFLPDGRHLLYLARGTSPETNTVFVRSLDADDAKPLLKGVSEARYSSGSLLFMRDTTLTAQRFDLDRLATVGDPVPVAENVRVVGAGSVAAAFSASLSGTLAYRTGALSATRQLALFDRTGKPIGELDMPAP